MRRLLALLLILGLGLAAPACRRAPEGTLKAVVIGGPPKLSAPARGERSAPDAVLLESVGQGLSRNVLSPDEEAAQKEEVLLDGLPAEQAVQAFTAGKIDLVLGGTFADLPVAQRSKLPRGSLQFDPASGLLGLVPVRSGTPFD